jgi:hypothetical protein
LRREIESRSSKPDGFVWKAGQPHGGHATRLIREGLKLYGSVARLQPA